MFHTNTVYKTRTHSSGVRIETDTRERLETKQTSIIQSTHMTLHRAQPIKNPKRQKS